MKQFNGQHFVLTNLLIFIFHKHIIKLLMILMTKKIVPIMI